MKIKMSSWLRCTVGLLLFSFFSILLSRIAIANTQSEIEGFTVLLEQDFTPWRRIHFDDATPKTVFTEPGIENTDSSQMLL